MSGVTPDDRQESSSTQREMLELSYAERVRTLMYLQPIGSLSTLSKKHAGWPFGSVMPYGLDQMGNPTFLISTMAIHTQNLQYSPKASLLVMEAAADEDPLEKARVTIMGEITQVVEEDLATIRESYLNQHQDARYWVDFGDFAFYRMEIIDLYFVGGFGVMGWVTAEEYQQAEVDPLADFAPEIIQHMNEDHTDALVLLSQHSSNHSSTQVRMITVDHLGFDLELTQNNQLQEIRLNFIRQVRNAAEVRKVLVEMVQQARAGDS